MKPIFDHLYSENWGVLDVLITDHSPIDLKRLSISDRNDAHHFVRTYGFDLDHPEDANEVDKIRREALDFIQTFFLDSLPDDYRSLYIPQTIQDADVIELLLLASSNPRAYLQKWACAVLRLMHTIAHVVSDLSVHYFPDIQKQILDPYYEHIVRKDNKIWLGKDPDSRIELVEFEVKAGKERSSALLKLLHKAENVAADIFDHIGVRFVTKDRLDTVLVLHFLRDQHLVAFPNVKPSRSVNTLIHFEKFRRNYKHFYQAYKNGLLNEVQFEEMLRENAQHHDVLTTRQVRHIFNRNPHTSRQYRSMQFTVRKLVRIANPLYAYQSEVQANIEQTSIVRERFYSARSAYRFFYPYEVQIVDLETHLNNTSGQASHEVYKQRQVDAARKRVLGRLLKKSRTPHSEEESWVEEGEPA